MKPCNGSRPEISEAFDLVPLCFRAFTDDGQRFPTIRAAKDEIIAWLLWYNQTRMHSTLNYVSPVEFEQSWTDQTLEIAA